MFRTFAMAREVTAKGYKMVTVDKNVIDAQFPNSFFRIKYPNQSLVVVDRGNLQELYNAPESEISFRKRISDTLELRYTFNPSMAVNSYHVGVIRAQLSKYLQDLMPDIVDELTSSFEDEFSVGNG